MIARAWLLCSLCAGSLLLTTTAAAQLRDGPERPHARELSLHSGYFLEHQSSRALVRFGMELADAEAFLIALLDNTVTEFIYRLPQAGDDLAVSQSNSAYLISTFRSAFGIVYLAASFYYIWYPYFHALHEFGHADRAYAARADKVSVQHDDGDTSHSNFFTYFPESVAVRGGGTTTFGGGSPEAPENWPAVVTMAGINTETQYAASLVRRFYLRGGDISNLIGYSLGKFAPYLYILEWEDREVEGETAQGDVSDILDYYDQQGYDIGESDIERGTWISVGTSQSSYLLALSTISWLFAGRHHHDIQSVELGAFKLPDLSFYLTTSGLSLRLLTGYRSGRTTFPFTIEQVYKGDPRTEVSVGFRHTFPAAPIPLTLGTTAYLAFEGFGFDASARVSLTDYARIDLGLAFLDRNTLHGERNTMDATRRRSLEGWGALVLTY